MNTLHSVFRNITEIIKKNDRVFLGFFIIFGALLRFILLPSTIWSGDAARDLLVSQHILIYHEIPNIGHVASGTNPVSYYPPLYYFLLAILQIPSTNTWYILSVFVLLNVASIGIFYCIAKRLSNSISALLATMLYTFSSYYLDQQTTLTSMHFALPLFFTGTLFHLAGIQKRQPSLVFFGLFFLVIASSINYAVLILIPIFLAWTFVTFKKDPKKTTYFICYVYILFIVIYFSLVKYIVTNYGWSTFLAPLSLDNNISIRNFPAHIVEQYYTLLSTVFPLYTRVFMGILLIAIIWITLQRPKQIISILYPISFLVTTLLLCAVKRGSVENYYYYLVAPFVFIIIGMCFQSKKTTVIAIILVSTIFVCAGWSSIRNSEWLFHRSRTYQETEHTVDTILTELKSVENVRFNQNLSFVAITALNKTNYYWEGLKYSFFFEKKIGKVFWI